MTVTYIKWNKFNPFRVSIDYFELPTERKVLKCLDEMGVKYKIRSDSVIFPHNNKFDAFSISIKKRDIPKFEEAYITTISNIVEDNDCEYSVKAASLFLHSLMYPNEWDRQKVVDLEC